MTVKEAIEILQTMPSGCQILVGQNDGGRETARSIKKEDVTSLFSHEKLSVVTIDVD